MGNADKIGNSDAIRTQGVNPATKAFSITASDSVNLDQPTRGILVTAAGNLSLLFFDDTASVTIPVDANVVYPFCVKRVNSTSTTATGIIGLY